MKKHICILFALLSSSLVFAQSNNSRVITNFDSTWKFSLGDSPKALQSNFNDDNCQNPNVPRDWSIEMENDKDVSGGGGVGFFSTGVAWYRKTFDVSQCEKDGEEYNFKVVTASEPARIRLSVDRNNIKADHSDVAHLSVEILDTDGHVASTADTLVRFEIEGAQDYWC